MGSDPDKTGNRPAEPAASAPRGFFRRPKTEAFVAPAHGFIPVFLILVLFLLAAVFVKPLFFGILAAVLILTQGKKKNSGNNAGKPQTTAVCNIRIVRVSRCILHVMPSMPSRTR